MPAASPTHIKLVMSLNGIQSKLVSGRVAELKNAYGCLRAECEKDDGVLEFSVALQMKRCEAGEITFNTFMKSVFDTFEIRANQRVMIEFENFNKPNGSKKLKNLFKDFVALHMESSRV